MRLRGLDGKRSNGTEWGEQRYYVAIRNIELNCPDCVEQEVWDRNCNETVSMLKEVYVHRVDHQYHNKL